MTPPAVLNRDIDRVDSSLRWELRRIRARKLAGELSGAAAEQLAASCARARDLRVAQLLDEAPRMRPAAVAS